jgi:hypothetical protein
MRSRALVLAVLLVSYGAVSARQPAVRTLAPLPAPSRAIADVLEIGNADRSQLVLTVIRTLYAIGAPAGDSGARTQLRQLIESPETARGEAVPLPLDPSIWRETILQRQVPDDSLMATIVMERGPALLYHGLAGLDDETLAWLGPERETLQHLLRRAGAFAVFGPSLRIRGGKVAVPGGEDLEAAWHSIVGAGADRPAQFVKHLFGDESGHLIWFYDALSQLDEANLKFVTGATLAPAARGDRLRALLDVFRDTGADRRLELQPFTRRTFDPALTLGVIRVKADGTLVGPASRALWDRLFENLDKDFNAAATIGTSGTAPIDAAWLLSRIHRVPIDIGRRRLESFLFAQRMFATARPADSAVGSIVRAYQAFPSLMLTLERAGVRSPEVLTAAAARAAALEHIGDERRQHAALRQFQATIGILDRISRSRGLPGGRVESLIASLSALDSSARGYDGRLAGWIERELLPAVTVAPSDDPDPKETALLAAMAGATGNQLRMVDWEGRAYRVSAARAEMGRLLRTRDRQGGARLSRVLALFDAGGAKQTVDRETQLADALTSILYAAYLGDPDGPVLNAGDVALRHDLSTGAMVGVRSAWRLPIEGHGVRGWRVSGSLLGLDVALARMALRRLDFNAMPLEPKLVSAERQTAALSVALMRATSLGDAERDQIAAALSRGRARLAALTTSGGSRADIEDAARDAGLSAWRREALAWAVVNDRDQLSTLLSPLEVMWLGKPAAVGHALDQWGATSMPLDGCLCLVMPAARPWEPLSGRPSLGLLATRGADVAILVAETLAEAKLPAELAPGVIAYAMQEVVDQARPSYMDDWTEFTRAVVAISREMLADFISAQAAGGGLLPSKNTDDRQP